MRDRMDAGHRPHVGGVNREPGTEGSPSFAAHLPAAGRLTLRPLTSEDDAFILELLNEPSFLAHIGDKQVRTLKDARAYIETGPQASYSMHGFGIECVELSSTGEPIGMCGLLKRDVLPDPDVGYAFLPRFWSRGYASEAVRIVLNDARQRLALKRVAAVVNNDNVASIRLLERIGFSFHCMFEFYEGEPDVRLYHVDL
jgi:[ribosomal protein S5]-alanine N-acetyltransferase